MTRAREKGAGTEGICAAVADVVEQVFATVQQVHAATVEGLDGGPEGLPGAIDGTVRELLLAPSQLAVGLGVILGPEGVAALGDPPGHPGLEPGMSVPQQFRWWQADPTAGSLQLLTPDLRPSSLGYYDYLTADWFEVPRRTGRRHVVGPYIDLNGTGQYLLTLTGPVMLGQQFVGVVGADVPVRRLEAHLMGVDGVGTAPYVLLNHERRVVLSTSPWWLVGALADVRSREPGPLPAGRPVAGVPWTLHGLGPQSAR